MFQFGQVMTTVSGVVSLWQPSFATPTTKSRVSPAATLTVPVYSGSLSVLATLYKDVVLFLRMLASVSPTSPAKNLASTVQVDVAGAVQRSTEYSLALQPGPNAIWPG